MSMRPRLAWVEINIEISLSEENARLSAALWRPQKNVSEKKYVEIQPACTLSLTYIFQSYAPFIMHKRGWMAAYFFLGLACMPCCHVVIFFQMFLFAFFPIIRPAWCLLVCTHSSMRRWIIYNISFIQLSFLRKKKQNWESNSCSYHSFGGRRVRGWSEIEIVKIQKRERVFVLLFIFFSFWLALPTDSSHFSTWNIWMNISPKLHSYWKRYTTSPTICWV